MRLPEVQTALRRTAAELRLFGDTRTLGGPVGLAITLEGLADAISRKPRATGAPVTSAPMTEALRARIRALHDAEPALTQHEIARRLGTNQGRVSETLAGKRR